MFIDQIKVYARAGHGGKGAIAFMREAYRPKGGPSGGNGGRGGDVILEASHDLNNLIAQFYNPRLLAEDGDHGMGQGMDGLAGKDIIIKVPCGTLVWRLPDEPKLEEGSDEDAEDGEKAESRKAQFLTSSQQRPVIRTSAGERAMEFNLEEEPEEQKTRSSPGNEGAELVADLTTDGQRFVLCKGGRGGLGNSNFATAARQTPRFAQPGESGTEGNYILELQIVAEVGLVGYPNAGKSTVLNAISRARPKIAAYPFTTLHPQIGIVEYEDFHRLTVCDIPGLIEGAHNDVGLGHKFLRHIERCKLLVILLDMAGTDNREPWDDYKQVISELGLYHEKLLEKPRYVVANKMDEAAAVENLKKFKKKNPKVPVLPISAAFDADSMDQFKELIRKAVATESADKASKKKKNK